VPDKTNTPLLIEGSVYQNLTDLTPEALEAKRATRLENTWTVKQRGSVALMTIKGTISRYDSWMNYILGGTAVEDMALDFQAALDNPNVKAIVLNFDTPGGDARGINEFAEIIRASSKPVTAYVGSMAASAGLWLATAAGEIVMDQTAEMGSLGVVFGYRVKDSSNIIEVVSAVSPKKRLGPDTDEGLKEVQRRADDLAQIFVSQVAKYRGVSEEKVKSDFGQGGMIIASKAIEAGMADKIGSLEEVIKDLQAQTNTVNGGFSMGLKTDLRTLLAGKPDEDIEAAMAAVGFTPEVSGKDKVDVEAVRAEGFAAGKAEGVTAGTEEHKVYATGIMSMCDLAGLGHMAAGMIEKGTLKADAQKELLAARAQGGERQISSNHDGGEKNPVAAAFEAVAKKEGA